MSVPVDPQLVIAELEHIAEEFAMDRTRDELVAALGTPTDESASGRVTLAAPSPFIEAIQVQLGGLYVEEVEAQLRAPLPVDALIGRYGRLEVHEMDARDDPREYSSDYLDRGGAYQISVAVRSSSASWDLVHTTVRTVYFHRRRR